MLFFQEAVQPDDFTYNEANNTYTRLEKKVLEYKGPVKLNRNSGDKYPKLDPQLKA
jgi:hypothetical protein